MRLPPPPRWLTLALLVVPFVLLSRLTLEIVDDAYITARYARNLANGQGLVFNPGEYVEGITNLLWTLVLAGTAKLGLPLDGTAVWLGIACGLGAMWVGGRIARVLGASAWASAFAMLLLGLNHHYWLIVGNGLEAGLFSLLASCTVESALARRRPALIGLLAGLTFLTRPESAAAAGLLALYLGSRNLTRVELPRSRDPALRDMAEMAAVFLLIFATATAFRLTYFHAFVPNSVTAKSVPAAALLPNLFKGVAYVATFARETMPLALGALIALATARRREPALVALVIATEVPAVLVNGGDWVGHSRLLIVYAPLMVALCALGTDWLYAQAAGPRRKLALSALALMIVLVPVGLLRNRAWSRELHAGPQLPSILECYRGVGERLIPVLKRGDVVATEAIGLIGYELPEIYIHDPLGLTDAYVARHGQYRPRIGRVDYAYSYAKIHPGVLLLHQDDMMVQDFAAASQGRFTSEYRAYYVEQGPPCSYYEKEGRDIRLVIAIRNDVAARVEPALRGVVLRPMQLEDGTTASRFSAH
jgi:arabinofuranosyltransferase